MGGPGGQVGVRGRGVRDAWLEACAARRRRYVEHLEAGHELHAGRAGGGRVQTHRQGVAQRKDTIERQERETVSVDWYRSTVDIPQKISSRYLSQDERISIADWRKAGMSVRGIARTLNRPASTASRELVRNTNPATGMYEPYRPQQMSADGPDDPSPRRSNGARPARIHSRRIAGALESRADRGAPARRFPG